MTLAWGPAAHTARRTSKPGRAGSRRIVRDLEISDEIQQWVFCVDICDFLLKCPPPWHCFVLLYCAHCYFRLLSSIASRRVRFSLRELEVECGEIKKQKVILGKWRSIGVCTNMKLYESELEGMETYLLTRRGGISIEQRYRWLFRWIYIHVGWNDMPVFYLLEMDESTLYSCQDKINYTKNAEVCTSTWNVGLQKS